jgi:predicted nucleotidyltransferase
LSTFAGSTIRETVRSVLGPAATVCLFGSRVDDTARGGDLDLLVKPLTLIEQPALVAARIGALLQRALGDQRIDVVIAAPNVQEQAIHRIARASGILL